MTTDKNTIGDSLHKDSSISLDANVSSMEREEVHNASIDSNQHVTPSDLGDTSVSSKIVKLCIWKKKGRPRKNQKKFSFLEIRGKKKKNSNKKLSGKEELNFIGMEQKDLATEVLETRIMMGLIPLKDRNEALQEIRARTTEGQ